MKLKVHKGWWLYNAILVAISTLIALFAGLYYQALFNVILVIGFLQGSKVIFWLSFISGAIVLLINMIEPKAEIEEALFTFGWSFIQMAFLVMLWIQISNEKKTGKKKI